SHAGTEDEVAAVGVRTRWGTENLDVVDFRSGGAGHALCFQLVADLSGLSEQVSGVAEFEQLSRQLGDEKPVAAVGHVAPNMSQVRHLQLDAASVAISRHVPDHPPPTLPHPPPPPPP